MTRQINSGAVFQPSRGLTRDEALKTVTVDAACILGLEDQIGSIESGKKADFSILAADPTPVSIQKLKNINAWGVMFEGEVYQAVRRKLPLRLTGYVGLTVLLSQRTNIA